MAAAEAFSPSIGAPEPAGQAADLALILERYLTAELLELPADARLYYRRAQVRRRLGAFAQAALDYATALARGFDDPVGLLIERAALHAEARDLPRAEADLSAAIGRDQRDVRGHLARARHRHRCGDHRGAVEDVSRAIAIEPERADSYYDRSAYWAALECLDEALGDLEVAMALDETALRAP